MDEISKYLRKGYLAITSQKSINIFILATTIVLLTFLLTSRYYLFQNVIESGISKKDIYASKTIKVIDSKKTDQRKRFVAKEIAPILVPAQNDYLKNTLINTMDSIEDVRKSNEPISVKKDNINALLNITEDDKNAANTISYLYKISDKKFNKIKAGSYKTLDKVSETGISETVLSKKDALILSEISNDYSITEKKVITFIIKKIIIPNMVIDELATEVAIKNAVNSVKPIIITFKKGQKIVSEGELVTKLQKSALKQMGYNISELNIIGIIGVFSFVLICTFIMTYYIVRFESKYLTPSYLSLVSIVTAFAVIFAVLLPIHFSVYLIPFAAMAILLTIFTDSRIALLLTILTITLISASLNYRIEAISIFLITTIFAIFKMAKINYTQRMDLIKIGFDIGLIQVTSIIAIYIFQNDINTISLSSLFTDVAAGLSSGIISAIIALGTLPLIENAFKIITPYGLAELADHNQPLLKRLQFEAPGTYHHSIMMSNLAESAAEAVGANQILVRVGAFYHDIGKLKRPLFFAENQSYFGIENPHEKLNPRLSKMVITAHPKDGIELAKEYKLPAVIHQFILQHHGDGLASYFYNQALKEEGEGNIKEEQFRYTCPKPTSKEVAIIMLADATESAVRSLKNPTPEQIETMIHKIIQERLFDGQLSESPLTQKDLKTIETSFNRIIRGMQHHRIKYHENVIHDLENKTIPKPSLPSVEDVETMIKIQNDKINKDKKND